MIQNSIIFSNKVIPNGFYTVKVVAIEKESAPNSYFPKLQIKLQLHPNYGYPPPDDMLFAVLHPTEKSYYLCKNFFHTFLFSNHVEIDIIDRAIGQWGSVKISKSVFEETEYSSVRFVYQPLDVRLETLKMSRVHEYGKKGK